jgi:hypothetical protein
MPEARVLQLSQLTRPAVGVGGLLPRKVLIRRSVVAFVLILLLGLVKQVITSREIGPDPLSVLPGGRSVTVGLDIGGAPTDYDLQALADSYKVDGDINLGGVSVAEQVTAASLHLAYLRLAVAPGEAPTLVQLSVMVGFMRSHTSQDRSVYLHDDVGGGRAVATADMLLLLRGESWSAVSKGVTAAEQRSLSASQMRSIQQLINSLSHQGLHSSSSNPYAAAQVEPW